MKDFFATIYYKFIRRLIPKYKDRLITTKQYWKLLAQRRKYGFDESETWSLDYSLNKLIVPRLKMFIKVACDLSVPSQFLLDEQNKSLARGFRWDYRWARLQNKKENQNCWNRAKKNWHNILMQMLNAFEDMLLEDEDWDNWNKKWVSEVNKVNNMLIKAKTRDERKQIWDSIKSGRPYREGIMCITDDIVTHMRKEGLRLFAEHYQSLWW